MKKVLLAGVSLAAISGGTVKAVRSLLDDPRVFDAVVVLLATWFLLSAYVVAWAYVIRPQGVVPETASAGLVAVSASWFALTGFLFFAFGRGLRRGRPWNRALPDGYVGTLVAALVFGAAWIADSSNPMTSAGVAVTARSTMISTKCMRAPAIQSIERAE